MTGAQWDRFAALAIDRKVSVICARGLELAHERMGTRIPAGVFARLAEAGASDAREPSAAFLRGERRQVDVLYSDLRALPTWRARGRLMMEHLFPPASYMLPAQPAAGRALLPLMYMRRIVRGVPKWLRAQRSPTP
jgi:hypothetical protein